MEAAEILQISRSTAYSYARKGILPTVNVGKKIYVSGWFMDGLYAAGLEIDENYRASEK
jgi:hypothetical protein